MVVVVAVVASAALVAVCARVVWSELRSQREAVARTKELEAWVDDLIDRCNAIGRR